MRAPAEQIVICGFSRSGTTLLYNMMRYAAPQAYSPPMEMAASELLSCRKPVVISKRPRDIFDLADLHHHNRGRKDIRLILSVRDPRAQVCSIHQSAPNQWFQGFDYCFRVADRLSFNDQGVLDMHAAVVAATQGPLPTMICRYEDLVADPAAMQRRIAAFGGISFPRNFADFLHQEIPPTLRYPLNGVRPVGAARAWQQDHRQRAQVVRQFRQAAELFDVLEHWGYETSRTWFQSLAHQGADGFADRQQTVVCCYTAGTRYAIEAERLARSLQRLSLPYVIEAVPNLGNWLANVRFKAQFLGAMREKISGPLLWLDADAVVHKDFTTYLSGYDGDLAVATVPGGAVDSATIWLNDTPGCRVALRAWLDVLAAHPTMNDQLALEWAIAETKGFTTQYLPPTMCHVFDHPLAARPWTQPYVEQLQASREGRLRGRRNLDALARRRDRVTEINTTLGLDNARIAGAEALDRALMPGCFVHGIAEIARLGKSILRRVLGKGRYDGLAKRTRRLRRHLHRRGN